MVITCRLWKSIKKYSLSPEDAKSHHWKVRFLLLNISFLAFAGFFYWKHNVYCESGSKYWISLERLLEQYILRNNVNYS
ncbi:hypothetical protein INR49_016461 [Caranx melampygus]|nr:hypothetical protein INR49_016461 [Caranx melampygus]